MDEDRSDDPLPPVSREEKKRFDPDSLIRAVRAEPLLEKIKATLAELLYVIIDASLRHDEGRQKTKAAIFDKAAIQTAGDGNINIIPCYFQPNRGGSSLSGETLLASHTNCCFRVPNLLLFRAGIGHSIWRPIGALFMAVRGKVALTRDAFAPDHFRHNYAAGVTLRAGGFPMAQLLFAWGGGEGTHNIATINPEVFGGRSRPSLY